MIRSLLLFAVSTLSFAASAQAQMSVLNEYYGRGVHAYNGGDLIKAYDFLSKAIDGGMKDPRAYYYRGLTSIASGREYEADADFQLGAELEAKGAFGPSIGMALSRIQGATRLKLEDARREARWLSKPQLELDRKLVTAKSKRQVVKCCVSHRAHEPPPHSQLRLRFHLLLKRRLQRMHLLVSPRWKPKTLSKAP